MSTLADRVSVVVATRDRRASLLRTLRALPAGPEVVVVDNGSRDGSAAAARRLGATVLALPRNAGAAARTDGVRRAGTPTSPSPTTTRGGRPARWSGPSSCWRPTPARRRRRPGAAGRRPGGRRQPEARPRPGRPLPGAPGPDALSFPAFAAVLRREAYLATGGFSRLLFFGGEEHLLALDLAAAGWQLSHCADVVARHDPAAGDVAPGRWARQTRNDLLVTWLRLPVATALRHTAALGARAVREPAAARALAGALRLLPAALARRRPVSRDLADRFATAQRPLG
ncbi:glycosyltransferase family 2 protein [Klenkia terrae]|uniref:glycosyltransferase family 2 protein n=1 Tax=Klenkia terrae TaxID=1052259 RepID=UPI003623DF97